MSKSPQSTRRPKTRKISDALEIVDAMMGNDTGLRRMADKALEDAIVGHLIYNARVKARLTQQQLADMIGSNQSVISRLEDADYRGHSLTMLRKIASALGKRVDIRLVNAA